MVLVDGQRITNGCMRQIHPQDRQACEQDVRTGQFQRAPAPERDESTPRMIRCAFRMCT